MTVSLLVLAFAGPVTQVRAWYGDGHIRATEMALRWGQDRIPAFLGQGMGIVAHCSVDPDVFRFETDSSVLYAAEYPDHFFDMEYFTSATLPKDRQAFVSWCLSHSRWFSKVGTLPYAVTEWTYRLATALAEYRRWPDDPAIQAKCQVYAGLLAHYAEDLCMPLHATLHYDGRANASGDSPHTGIHAKVDALIGKVACPAWGTPDPNELIPFEECLNSCLAEIRASNGLVDQVYDLELDLPDPNDPVRQGSPIEAFAQERLRATAMFTARVFVTAWEKSKTVDIPDWHQRTPVGGP